MKRLTRNEILFFVAAIMPVETYIRLLIIGIPILAYCTCYLINQVIDEIERREMEEQEEEVSCDFRNIINLIRRV